jgi:hypothetical protein
MADKTIELIKAAEAARGRRIAAEADWGDAAAEVRACTARTLSKSALAYLHGRGLGAAFWKGGKLSAEECDEVEAAIGRMDGPEVARTIKAARRLNDAEAALWESRFAEGEAGRACADAGIGLAAKTNPLFEGHAYAGGFWIRILGRGVSVVDRARHPPLFGERAGSRKAVRLGRWAVTYLAKERKA